MSEATGDHAIKSQTESQLESQLERQERGQIMVNGRDISSFGGERRQALAGFDADYSDFVDYIIGCTHKIWEEKAIGLIYTHYSHNCPIYMTDALIYGRDAVVEGTIKTLAAFPDVRLFGDEVIWSGNEKDGFHSSHRISWTGHNTGHGVYGPPTNRKIQRRGIAHCLVRENRIIEEWLVRDELALVRQLGLDEIELARTHAAREAAAGKPAYASAHGEVPRLNGQHHPPLEVAGDLSDPDVFSRKLFAEVWNARMLNRIRAYYQPGCVAWVSTNRRLDGAGDYTHFVLQMLAAFPDGAMRVDHVCWIGSETQGYKIATRWTFQGTHEGPSAYGAPSGKRIALMGITHQEVSISKDNAGTQGRVEREWTVFDEFALLKQIHWPEA